MLNGSLLVPLLVLLARNGCRHVRNAPCRGPLLVKMRQGGRENRGYGKGAVDLGGRCIIEIFDMLRRGRPKLEAGLLMSTMVILVGMMDC